jgi:hypothetical protein
MPNFGAVWALERGRVTEPIGEVAGARGLGNSPRASEASCREGGVWRRGRAPVKQVAQGRPAFLRRMLSWSMTAGFTIGPARRHPMTRALVGWRRSGTSSLLLVADPRETGPRCPRRCARARCGSTSWPGSAHSWVGHMWHSAPTHGFAAYSGHAYGNERRCEHGRVRPARLVDHMCDSVRSRCRVHPATCHYAARKLGLAGWSFLHNGAIPAR